MSDLPDVLAVDNLESGRKVIKSAVRKFAEVHMTDSPDEYIEAGATKTIYKAHIVDLNLETVELGHDIALKIRATRLAAGLDFPPIILLSIREDLLDDLKKEWGTDGPFRAYVWKDDPNYVKLLQEALVNCLAIGTDLCKELEHRINTVIDERKARMKISKDEARKYVEEYPISGVDIDEKLFDGIVVDPYEDTFREKNTIKTLIQDCKEANEDDQIVIKKAIQIALTKINLEKR